MRSYLDSTDQIAESVNFINWKDQRFTKEPELMRLGDEDVFPSGQQADGLDVDRARTMREEEERDARWEERRTDETSSSRYARVMALYLREGKEGQLEPQVVYSDPQCPHAGCDRRLKAINFRLKTYDKTIYEPLIRAWWDDEGFVGHCPGCTRWVHFKVREKRALSDEEATRLPNLPNNWYDRAKVV